MEPTGNPPPYTPPTSVIRTPTIFGRNPMQVTCSNCRLPITTSIAHEFGSCTIIAAVTIFIFFFPCFWIPLVMDSCKDVHHICPSCNAHLGTYKLI